jgi:hypothetical protein
MAAFAENFNHKRFNHAVILNRMEMAPEAAPLL